MKKYIICALFLTILTACSGNPPAWWNPSGRYSNPSSTSATVPVSTQVPVRSVSTPEQETLLPVDTDYEEMALSPIVAEEDIPTSTDLEPSILEE